GSHTEFLALIEQQLAVDQSTQNVFLLVGYDLIGVLRILTLRFLLDLLLFALILRASNNLVINARNNLFDHCIGRDNTARSKQNQQNQTGEDLGHKSRKVMMRAAGRADN